MDNTRILGKIIDLLRVEGIQIDSPYDFENFIADNASHSNLFDTGRFHSHWFPVPPTHSDRPECKDGLLPDGPVCPKCGGARGPSSGLGGDTWVHILA